MTVLKQAKSKSGYTVTMYRYDYDKYGHYFIIHSSHPNALDEMAWEVGESLWIFREYLKD